MSPAKGLVLYKSKYGAARRYAAMLAQEMGCDVCDVGSIGTRDLDAYAWIVFAGGVYASGMLGLSAFKRLYMRYPQKKWAVLFVGASPFDEKALADVKARNLKGSLRHIPAFYGRGAWDESKMTWKDRALCQMLQKAVARREPASCEPWMRALLSAAGQARDWTDRKYLLPLFDFLHDKN